MSYGPFAQYSSQSRTSPTIDSANISSDPQQQQQQQQYDWDPSTPGRRVLHKKANTPFLAHQKWKQKQQQEAEAAAAAVAEKEKIKQREQVADTTTTTSDKARMNASSTSGRTPKIVELPPDDPSKPTHTSRSNGSSKGAASKAAKSKATSSSSGKEHAAASSSTSWAYFLFKWALFSILLAVGAGQFIAGDVLWGYRGRYVKKETYVPESTLRRFSMEELSQYNGQDPDKPIYLSILGNVYDVSANPLMYGPRGSYRFFAGRDASRSYVTGCFETHLTHDLRGLTVADIAGIQGWKEFFDDHGRYSLVGKADLPPIDPKSPIPAPCHDNAEQKNPSEV